MILTAIIKLLEPLFIYITNPAAIKENPKNFASLVFTAIMGGLAIWNPDFNAGQYSELISITINWFVTIGLMVYAYYSRKMNIPIKP